MHVVRSACVASGIVGWEKRKKCNMMSLRLKKKLSLNIRETLPNWFEPRNSRILHPSWELVSVSLTKIKEFLLRILNMKKKKFPLKSWYYLLKQAEFTQNPSDILIFKPKQMDSKNKKKSKKRARRFIVIKLALGAVHTSISCLLACFIAVYHKAAYQQPSWVGYSLFSSSFFWNSPKRRCTARLVNVL